MNVFIAWVLSLFYALADQYGIDSLTDFIWSMWPAVLAILIFSLMAGILASIRFR